MSCFGAAYYSPSSGIGGGRRPWRWWRAKCAGIAAAVGSRLRRSIRGIDGRRRRRTSFPSSSYVHAQPHRHSHHRRSFVPVYVDELYSHQHQPAAKATLRVVQQDYEPPTSTRDAAKLAAPAAAAPPAVHAAKLTPAAAAPSAVHAAAGATARATGGKPSADACRRVVPPRVCGGAAATAAVRNVLLRSPGRGGGGVLGAVKGMGEVDLRAELFIRKFKEDMRLQSQRSAEEFQAMLARGL